MNAARAEAEELSRRLRELAPDPIPPPPIVATAHRFYGVRIPELRRLAARWCAERRALPPAVVVAMAKLLWRTGVREEMVLAGMILRRRPDALAGLDVSTIEELLPALDNWELVDNLAGDVTGPWLVEEPEQRMGWIRRLATAEHPWSRRLALVTCIGLARRPDAARRWPPVSELITALAGDRAAALPKAISWALRAFARSCPAEVRAYLEEEGSALPAGAVRETRRFLETGRKGASL